jgi:hypothetical protein
LHGNNDTINGGIWAAEGAEFRGEELKLIMDIAFALPIYDFHASITASQQKFDHRASPLPATQNIYPLAKHGKAYDPLVGPAPEDKKNRNEKSSHKINIRAYIHLRNKIYEPGENKRQHAENKQQSKVNFPSL